MSDEEFTIFCRNLSEEVTESLLYELFLQAGPVEDVRIPMVDGRNRNYGFVVFKHKCSVRYAIELLRDTKLYGKVLLLQNRLCDAERQAKMHNKRLEDLRNNELNDFRRGPQLNFARFDDINVLRAGPVSLSRNDELNSLRGGSSDAFSRGSNMLPKGLCDANFRNSSCKSNDPVDEYRLQNPYASFDLRSSLSRRKNHMDQTYPDRDSARFRNSHYKHSSSRRDHNYRSDRDYKHKSSHRSRSRSRERSYGYGDRQHHNR